MTLTPLTDGWTLITVDGREQAVTVPHDAMIGEIRSADAPSAAHGAYFSGGRYIYRTALPVPPDLADRYLELVFEGVYGDTTVRVDGDVAATNAGGYREFQVPLEGLLVPGRPATIEVEVDNTAQPNARWYTGSGLYRRVWLRDVASTRFATDGLRFTTRITNRGVELESIVEVEGAFAPAHDAPFEVHVVLAFNGAVVAEGRSELVGASERLLLEVPEPRLWSDESPHLYDATVRLLSGERELDREDLRLGLRSIDIDSRFGLRINGQTVLLRGACVHHDNGVLGAATYRAAEFRRARILKANGFNAVRSSHNPLSRDFLDACDEVGLYVMDELTDVWFAPKTAHDESSRFTKSWREDARSMVGKDRNHPSVIMYSIGNEIGETGTARGIELTRELSQFVRELDPSRPTTLALNFMLNMMATRGKTPFDASEHDAARAAKRKPKKASAVTSTMANVVANRLAFAMQLIARLPKADRVSRDAFAQVDIAGYNYGWSRFPGDARRHPDRVMVGSESMPGDIVGSWALVERTPAAIGDFIWTGWDYLGEAGIGVWQYGKAEMTFGKPFPYLVAGPGAIDITGIPGAPALLARATWGQLDAPQIAVRPLNHSGERAIRTAWRASDAVQSWSWSGCEGRTAEIEVYSGDDEVELLLNGVSLGRKPAGRRRQFVTRFRTAYRPGELTVVGYRGGRESGRSSLRTAFEPRLTLRSERESVTADGQDLAYIWVEIADEAGVVEMLADDRVSVAIDGPGALAGFGSAAPATEESFLDHRHSTYGGRALAIVRATHDTGEITVTAVSSVHGMAKLTVPAVAPASQREGRAAIPAAS